jgi:Flp pilus assembly protein TadD
MWRRCAGKITAGVSTNGTTTESVNLILLGCRNDVARARVIAHLRQVVPSEHGPAPVGHDTPLPLRLFHGLTVEQARKLQAELDEIGAQTALVSIGGALVAAEATVSPPTKTGALWLGMIVVAALAGTTFLWRLAPQPRKAVMPALPAPLSNAAPVYEKHTQAHANDPDDDEASALNNEAVQLAEAGDYSAAANRLRHALELSPRDDVPRHNLYTVLFNWGAHELQAGRAAEAQQHLQDAAELEHSTEVLRTLGIAYLRSGDRDQAKRTLEEALQTNARDSTSLLALAEVYVDDDRRAEALDLLHRAKEAGAKGADLDEMVARLSREVDAEWDFVNLQSRHFAVSFADAEDRSTVEVVLDALEDAYDDVGRKFDFHPDEPTMVVLYTKQDFHTVTNTPDWAGAAFDGRIKIPVGGLTAQDANLDRMVRHEYAHSLIAQLAHGRCPLWLNEGLAMWAEESRDAERLGWAEDTVAGGELFSFSELGRSFTRLSTERAQVAYAQSYLVVRELVDRYGSYDIPELLTELGRGRSLADAFSEVYREDLSAFQDRVWSRRASTGSRAGTASRRCRLPSLDNGIQAPRIRNAFESPLALVRAPDRRADGEVFHWPVRSGLTIPPCDRRTRRRNGEEAAACARAPFAPLDFAAFHLYLWAYQGG